MKDIDLISIILPTFNCVEYIEASISSVLSQSYQNWELIIVDDKSTDHTCDIVKGFQSRESRIKFIQLKNNSGGPAIPRNTGLDAASGSYVAFLDADDVWHPQKLAIQLEQMRLMKVDLLCSRIKNFTSYDQIDYADTNFNNLESKKIKFLRLRNRIPTSSVFGKSELFVKHKFDANFPIVEDFHLWLRLSSAGFSIAKINHILVYYRVSDNQISKSKIYMLVLLFRMHMALSNNNFFTSFVFVFTHLIGALYMRKFRKIM